MADGRIYMLQPSFSAGEISPDVASRVDLDKYQSALLQAENVFIRPYGSAYRRPGTEYVDSVSSGNVRLKEFSVDADNSYLLVFQEGYIYIYKDDALVHTISGTPFLADELHKLRFAQSGDVMWITSGTHPVQVLTRTNDTPPWTLADFVPSHPYFDYTTMTDGVTIIPSATSGSVTLTASSDVFTSGQVGNSIQIEQQQAAQTVTLSGSGSMTDTGTTTPMQCYVSGWTISITGTWTGTVNFQEYDSEWETKRTYTANTSDSGTVSTSRNIRASVTVATGSCTVTLTRLAWTDNTDPLNPITYAAQTETLTCTNSASASVLAGPEGWKVVSHGTWAGTFNVQYSDDDSTWKTLREYSSDSDYNVSESGTFDVPTYIRATANLTSGSITIDLTRLPYTHIGNATITAYTSGTVVTATVNEDFADTSAADEWAFGSWSDTYGYPSCVTFFQNRLCFAANTSKPYMVWMSRTDDYFNFGVEKVSGTVTDDSAVAVAFITRKDFRILHLVAHSDLLVMTEGNEWIVNGSEVVTPTNITPRVQTSRGSTDVAPEMIGGQLIYVQRHGKTVRDLQYNFGTDSYDGQDLTILAKHLTQDATIVDSAYRQEPDYMCFFVLSSDDDDIDGTVACLTYVNEQRVYAWCRMITNGKITAVESISTEDYDDVYFCVERDGTNYLEKLADYPHSSDPDEYVLLDCALADKHNSPSTTITASWLAEKTVDVLADGRHIRGLTADSNGAVELPVACEEYVVGIPYKSIWELPNIEFQLNDGTMQGRRKKVAEVILRLENSLGGRVGINTNKTDVIKYDEFGATPVPEDVDPLLIPPSAEEVELFSGEKIVTVPNVTAGGFNDRGRVAITSDEPYPLSISSIVRAVVPGG